MVTIRDICPTAPEPVRAFLDDRFIVEHRQALAALNGADTGSADTARALADLDAGLEAIAVQLAELRAELVPVAVFVAELAALKKGAKGTGPLGLIKLLTG